jgi:hypothetical protein
VRCLCVRECVGMNKTRRSKPLESVIGNCGGLGQADA